jgi:hypothetical protein
MTRVRLHVLRLAAKGYLQPLHPNNYGFAGRIRQYSVNTLHRKEDSETLCVSYSTCGFPCNGGVGHALECSIDWFDLGRVLCFPPLYQTKMLDCSPTDCNNHPLQQLDPTQHNTPQWTPVPPLVAPMEVCRTGFPQRSRPPLVAFNSHDGLQVGRCLSSSPILLGFNRRLPPLISSC